MTAMGGAPLRRVARAVALRLWHWLRVRAASSLLVFYVFLGGLTFAPPDPGRFDQIPASLGFTAVCFLLVPLPAALILILLSGRHVSEIILARRNFQNVALTVLAGTVLTCVSVFFSHSYWSFFTPAAFLLCLALLAVFAALFVTDDPKQVRRLRRLTFFGIGALAATWLAASLALSWRMAGEARRVAGERPFALMIQKAGYGQQMIYSPDLPDIWMFQRWMHGRPFAEAGNYGRYYFMELQVHDPKTCLAYAYHWSFLQGLAFVPEKAELFSSRSGEGECAGK